MNQIVTAVSLEVGRCNLNWLPVLVFNSAFDFQFLGRWKDVVDSVAWLRAEVLVSQFRLDFVHKSLRNRRWRELNTSRGLSIFDMRLFLFVEAFVSVLDYVYRVSIAFAGSEGRCFCINLR